jgi:hypothetical protein
MMSRAVEFCRAQKRDIVVLPEILHELGYELLGRKTTESTILGRDDDVEPAVRIGDLSADLHAAENRTGGYGGYPESFADILSGEVVAPLRGKVGHEFGSVSHKSILA